MFFMLDSLAVTVKALRKLRYLVIANIVLSAFNVFGLFILTGNQYQMFKLSKQAVAIVEQIQTQTKVEQK